MPRQYAAGETRTTHHQLDLLGQGIIPFTLRPQDGVGEQTLRKPLCDGKPGLPPFQSRRLYMKVLPCNRRRGVLWYSPGSGALGGRFLLQTLRASRFAYPGRWAGRRDGGRRGDEPAGGRFCVGGLTLVGSSCCWGMRHKSRNRTRFARVASSLSVHSTLTTVLHSTVTSHYMMPSFQYTT